MSIAVIIVAIGIVWILVKAEDRMFTEEIENIPPSPEASVCTKDTDCPSNFACMQTCGPPVLQYPDDTPPKYFCQPKGYVQNCPICLAKHTLIDTPQGAVAVEDLQKGAPIWTVTSSGTRVVEKISQVSKVAVPSDHKMVKFMVEDGRILIVSPGHPTIDGRTVGNLAVGDEYDGSRVISADRISYDDGYTYDILPSGETGFYFANGILVGSTLH